MTDNKQIPMTEIRYSKRLKTGSYQYCKAFDYSTSYRTEVVIDCHHFQMFWSLSIALKLVACSLDLSKFGYWKLEFICYL
jgi:hypothetical protein